jgi:C-terminal processing protease CtpA/Prc
MTYANDHVTTIPGAGLQERARGGRAAMRASLIAVLAVAGAAAGAPAIAQSTAKPASAPTPEAAEQAAAAAAQRAEAASARVEARAKAVEARARAAEARSQAADAEVERELAAARERLEQAAREVAALSQKMAGEDVLRYRVGAGARRPMLGVQLGEGRPQGGVRVTTVSPGGPAAVAGLKAGDVIVSVNGQKTKDARDVAERVRALEPGAEAKLDVERDGRVQPIVVVTRAMEPRVVVMTRQGLDGAPVPMPEVMPLPMEFERFRPWGDLELATLTKDLGRYFGAERGVLVVKAPADGRLPLRDGDVITTIDGRAPQSGSHALRILRSYQPGEKATLQILRDRRAQKLEVTMPPAGPAVPGMPATPPSPGAPAAPAAPNPA